jgi:putative redox protein
MATTHREVHKVAHATARIGTDRRMNADRRDWPLEGLNVQLTYRVQDGATRWIDRAITLRGPLDDDQHARLAEIAEKTPVTRAVRAGTEIRTTIDRA